MSETPTLVIVSGYFGPMHAGHLDYIEAGAAAGDELYVIVNNNVQQTLKKGKIIMDEGDRHRIVAALRVVDHAMIAVDQVTMPTVLSGAALLWIPNVVCLALGVWLFRRASFR